MANRINDFGPKQMVRMESLEDIITLIFTSKVSLEKKKKDLSRIFQLVLPGDKSALDHYTLQLEQRERFKPGGKFQN